MDYQSIYTKNKSRNTVEVVCGIPNPGCSLIDKINLMLVFIYFIIREK